MCMKAAEKGQGPHGRRLWIRGCRSEEAAGGMCGVAVKGVDVKQNAGGEGIWRIRK